MASYLFTFTSSTSLNLKLIRISHAQEHRSSQMQMEMEDDSTSVRSGGTPDVKMSEPEPPVGVAVVPPAVSVPDAPESPRAAAPAPPVPTVSMPATEPTPTPTPATAATPAPAAAKRPLEEEHAADRKAPAPKKEKGPAPPPPVTPPQTPVVASAPAPSPVPASVSVPASAKKQPAPPPPPPPPAISVTAAPESPTTKGRQIVQQVCQDAEKAVQEKRTKEFKTEQKEETKPIVITDSRTREEISPEKYDRIDSKTERVEVKTEKVIKNEINQKEERLEKDRSSRKEERLEKDRATEITSVSPVPTPPPSSPTPIQAPSIVTVQSPTVIVEIRDRTSPPVPQAAPPYPEVAKIADVSPYNEERAEPNSLAGTPVGRVTVTTTHPPVLVDSEPLPPNAVTISTPPPIADEVVIVGADGRGVVPPAVTATATTTSSTTSSDDDCFAPSSLDSLDCSAAYNERVRGRRLDSSEVLILSPAAVGDSGVFDESAHNLDTSHVSVVTVGGDSAATHIAVNESPPPSRSRTHSRLNGERVSPDSLSRRSQSDSGSVVSSCEVGGRQPDADSVATSGSHDDHGVVVAAANHAVNGGARVNTNPQDLDSEDQVVLRRRPQDGQQANRIQRTKEDIHMANLKKKTRKRTRKFEIDGVVVTTTTSKVIWGDEESGRTWDDHALRKQELREIKMLQKLEQKQLQDLNAKEHQLKEQQDKRYPITFQAAGNAPVPPLELRVSMGGGDNLLSDRLSPHSPS
ncbi:hypothetical protein EVAR_16812_1 [Eumeta japonica]|uniref:Uncharacterized protein n=1 Tax=Eumeta variegata TaxID=151549 RepID=A0A4C1V299_EUMVA|nr:hypothetical protein EVAR_16812_1 [Eumeta japonica]